MPRPAHLLPPLTPEHYAAIGRVAMEWTALEGYVGYSVGELLGVAYTVGKIVTTHTQFLPNCEMLKALLDMRFPDISKEVRRLRTLIETCTDDKPNHADISKRRGLRSRRNELIHGSWIEASEPPQIYTVSYKARGKLKHTVTIHTVEKINALADEISEMTGQLCDGLQPLLARWREASKKRPRWP